MENFWLDFTPTHHRPNTIFSDVKQKFQALKNADDFNMAQLRDGISIGYKPMYPEETPADFSIWIGGGKIKMYGNKHAMIPTIKEYASLDALIADLQKMDMPNAQKKSK